ncbi:TPA: WxL domain-containing protein [Bacillus cereus]|nr:WxL domain-containing protein [Bacillus cereus]
MKKVVKIFTLILVLFAAVFSNVGNMDVYAAEYPDNPDTLPIVHFVKNEKSGLVYGATGGSNNSTTSDIADADAPSGYVMRAFASKKSNISQGALTWYQSGLYANTNYTAEYIVKNVGTGPVSRWDTFDGTYKKENIGPNYVTIRKTFKTQGNNSAGTNQVTPPIKILEDWRVDDVINRDMDLRFMSVKYIPNTPVITVANQKLTVKLSDVKGKNRAEIFQNYKTQIETLLNASSIDTNNNNNKVLATVSDIPNSQTVINSGLDGFEVDILAKKWGQQKNGKLEIEIVDDLPAEKPEINPIKEADKEITGKGTPGDEIIVRDSKGKEIGKTAVDKEGNWKVEVPEGTKLNKDDEITAKAKKSGIDKESDPAKQVVTGNTPPVLMSPFIHAKNYDYWEASAYWRDIDSEEVTAYYVIDSGIPQKIGDYKNTNPGTDMEIGFKIPNTEEFRLKNHNIELYFVDKEGAKSETHTFKTARGLQLTEKVYDANGKEVKEVYPGETLRYEIELLLPDYLMWNSDSVGVYTKADFIQTYDESLETPTDLKMLTADGKQIKASSSVYDADTNKLKSSLGIKGEQNPMGLKGYPMRSPIKVVYYAKVKKDVKAGTIIIAKGKAESSFLFSELMVTRPIIDPETIMKATSNEVKLTVKANPGELKFVSAPSVIDFGSKLKISPQHQTYHPIQLDQPLAVQDSRALSENPSWMMTVKLDQPLKGKKTGSILNGLHYRYGGSDSILSEEASVEVYKKKTENDEIFNITDIWNKDGDGLYLDVKAGTAKSDAYEGIINWTLQDVPMND